MKTQKPDDRTVARMVLLNLLVMPGLGSLRAGRWLAGSGQILTVIAGAVLMLVWLYEELSQYYGLMFNDIKPKSYVWMFATGGILLIVSWVWALITSISYHQQNTLKNQGTSMSNENPAEKPANTPPILATSQPVPNWQRQGEIIWRKFQFKDFVTAMKFVNDVAQAAEQMQHHPDIDIRWNKVTLALTTHDAGGLTEKDFTLARQCNALAGG